MESQKQQKIIIFYNDTFDRVSRIEGILVSSENEFITINSQNKQILIPKNKIVRMEVLNE